MSATHGESCSLWQFPHPLVPLVLAGSLDASGCVVKVSPFSQWLILLLWAFFGSRSRVMGWIVSLPFELWCWRRLSRVPWTVRRSNQSILKAISPGISLEGMMLKLKLPYFSTSWKSWLIGKDSDVGRDWGQEEKETAEDEMAGWHHRLDGRESEWTPGVGDGQGCLACCDSWGRKELDTTEQLNWTETVLSFCKNKNHKLCIKCFLCASHHANMKSCISW